MEYKFHVVDKEEKLSSIAAKYNIAPSEIKAHNPELKTFGGFVGGEFVSVGQKVRIPIADLVKSEPIVGDNYLYHLKFEQKARYRCEQVNISNVNGNMAHFAEQKYQYALEQSFNDGLGKVKLEEHLYKFEPSTLNLTFDFLSQTEFIKNNVIFSLSKKSGKIKEILNKKEIYKEWINFRENKFSKADFIKRLQQTNPEAVRHLKELGNKQFAPNYELVEEEYRRNLFYFICFDKFIYHPLEELSIQEFEYMSTIVPPIIVPLTFRYDKISEDNERLNIRKVGKLKLEPELLEKIKLKYDELHKPFIKFGFTEYKLEFRVRLEINKQEKLVETADLFIMEQIADNIDNTCEFHLKRLHNYTQ